MTGRDRRAAATVLVALAAFAGTAVAADPVRLRPGAVEAGLGGAVVSRGTTSVQVTTRAGMHRSLAGPDGRALLGVEAAAAYVRVRELDSLDVLASVSCSVPLPGTPHVVPFAAATAGVRQEWVGSFRESRVPVGGAVGVRVLTGRTSALRAEYAVLRVLDDPVGHRTEQQLLVGVSLLFRND